MYAKHNEGLDRALGPQEVIYSWVRPHFDHENSPAASLGWIDQPITFEETVRMPLILRWKMGVGRVLSAKGYVFRSLTKIGLKFSYTANK
ncbi:hypothetical protein SCG7086_AE_00200 [Chlamydiales bacterium SCGC AG-110-P3]|nr:hypothetical protein SCG7086_AE_00200 [Chlamydiales bacterium SCGC AG-110-P3]